MSVPRRVLAAASVAALACAAATPADAAPAIRTLPCIGYVAGQSTMPIFGTGFSPGGAVMLYTNTVGKPTPVPLVTPTVSLIGAFQLQLAPPQFSSPSKNLQTFKLIAQDATAPNAPVVVATQFQLVRFGLTQSPAAQYPGQPVTYTARGFRPGKPVYMHFRFAGITRRTVTLGTAAAPCGVVSRTISALPTKIRYGAWKAYVDQTKQFASATRPQWIDSFTITPPKKLPKKKTKKATSPAKH